MITDDFTSDIVTENIDALKIQLERFVSRHVLEHRPICLLTSGGTACDLEQNAVRSLENFSTGLRGAIFVEELLRKGYAVIHLSRKGSAAPFARVLNQYLGLDQANFCLDVESLGKLFVNNSNNDSADDENDLVTSILNQQIDPWLTDNADQEELPEDNRSKGKFSLHKGITFSTRVQTTLKERSNALREGRLLSIYFRTVEDYLGKLQLSALTLSTAKSLGLIILSAAVSDFYIPKNERVIHKIQSKANEDGLVLHLRPVPKVMGMIRKAWAPEAFLVAFKLETDMNILRSKAEGAVLKYGCHAVIGNILQSRYEKVWILAPNDGRDRPGDGFDDWSFTEISKSRDDIDDALEMGIVDFIVQSHFNFISVHFSPDNSLVLAASKMWDVAVERKRIEKRSLAVKKYKIIVINAASAILTMTLSFALNKAVHKWIWRRS